MFIDRELFEKDFDFAQGKVGVIAEIKIDSGTLTLDNLTIYPRGFARREIGVKNMLSIKRYIIEEARAQGFQRLRVSGIRAAGSSSVNPDRSFDYAIELS